MLIKKFVGGLALLCLALFLSPTFNSRAAANANKTADNAARFSQYANLPLRFEAHQDRFLARGDGYAVELNGSEAVFNFRDGAKSAPSKKVKMSLVGAQTSARTTGQEPLPTVSNYFLGNDPARWRTNVANFARVKVEQVYPGIDLVWYGNQRRLEYDFQLAPGARLERIKLAFEGARIVRLDGDGALVLRAGEAEARLLKPVAWQEANGRRREIPCHYSFVGKQVGFRLGAYDKSLPLVIDPVLVYSTFLGGSGFDEARAVAVDADGNAYITGSTSSPDFPGSSLIQANRSAGNDVFVLKLNPAGNAVVYATWLGGNGSEGVESIAVDAAGNAVVTGTTSSTNFPTKDPLQAARRDGAEGYVTKLNAAGTALVYSTYLGGSSTDAPNGVAVDAAGNAYVTGYTESQDFPLMNALQPIRQGSPVYATGNAGADWTITDNSLTAGNVSDLAIDPTNPSVIYAATNQGIFKTLTSGATWAKTGGQFEFQPSRLLIDPTAPMTIYALGAGLLKSTNGGESFSPLTNIRSVFSVMIATTSPATLYALTNDGVLRSADGGATWTPVTVRVGSGGEVRDLRSFVADPVTPTTLYAGGSQAAYKSTDAGATWQTINNGLTPGPGFAVRFLFISRSNPAVLVTLVEVSSTYRLYRTTNGGASWGSIDIPNIFLPAAGLTLPPDVVMDPTDANIIYVGTSRDGVYKSTDGGSTWNAVNNGLNNTAITALAIPSSLPMTIYAGTASGSARAFVTKINPMGSALVYSTYLGGSNGDYGSDIAVDADGNVYVAGSTNSKDFPTRNAYQAALKGDFDAFVTKINPAGSALVWSTFIGGSNRDSVSGLAVSGAGNAFITGTTISTNFPVVKAIQPANRSIPPAIHDIFVVRLAADGQSLDYSTYLGGRENENMTPDIAVDAAGNAYVTGTTPSTDFPVVNAVQTQRGGDPQRFSEDAFVTKINADGSALLFSTFLGGGQGENGSGIAVDAAGNAYVVGGTDSADFPLTPGALRTTSRPRDGFIAKFGISADLAVTIRDEPDPVQVNGTLTYRVVVTNNGADTAMNANITITLPAGPTVVSVNSTSGSCTGSGQLTCTLGNPAALTRATVTIVLKPTAAGEVTIQATAGSATFDALSANNTASQTTKVSALPSIFGRVTTSDGQGVNGVTLSLSPQIRAAMTDAGGNYQFGELAAGANYAVVPTKPGFTFFPVNREFNNLTADQRADFTAVQCSFTVAPQSTVFTATGGAGSVTVTANNPACAWTARSTVPWIRLTSGSSSSGTGPAIFTVEPTTAARRGELVVAGQVVAVRQESNVCTELAYQSAPITLSEQTQGNSVVLAAADINGDRITDVALRSSSTELLIRFGNGAGGFSARTSITVSATAVTPIGADYNRDGKPDIAVFDAAAGTLTLLLNDGAGRFAATTPINPGGNSRLLTLGDFTGDGVEDFLFSGANGVRLLASAGTGGFTNRAASLSLEPNGVFFDRGDFNGDGNLDLLAFIPAPFQGSPATISVLFGDGNGNFLGSVVQSVAGLKPGLQIADYDNDGKADLALVTAEPRPSAGHGIVVAFSKGDGRFGTSNEAIAPNVFLSAPEILTVLADDLNGDGITDLRATTRFTNQLLLFIGQSNGQFRASETVSINTENSSPQAGDFNGDGRVDLLMTTLTGKATLLLNRASCASAGSLALTSAASFFQLRIAGESIASAFGANLANEVVAATSTPLPTTLGGSSVRIRDSAGREFDAPLFFVSPGQINLLVPRGQANGPAVATVRRGGNVVATGVIEIVAVNPGLLAADATGTGYAAAVVLRVKADGSQVFEPVVQFNAAQNRFDPVPITVNNPGEQVFLLLFGTGIRNRSSLSNVGLLIGGEPATVDYAGDQGGFAGLDQLNVRLSPNLAGKGDVNLDLTVDGKAANTVRVRIR